MHAVVNHLPIREGTDWSELATKFGAFETATQQTHSAFAEHVRPYLLGPVSRSVGELIAGTGVAH
jgi:hypothetical protein